MLRVLLVFVGAGAGGVARHGVSLLVQAALPPGAWALATLVVNVSGCLVMGLLATLWEAPGPGREELRAGVLTGVLGGYTTFSAFGRDTFTLVNDERPVAAGAYVLLSVGLSLAGAWLGRGLGLWIRRGSGAA